MTLISLLNKNNDLHYRLTPALLHRCVLSGLPESLDRQGNPPPRFRTSFLCRLAGQAVPRKQTLSDLKAQPACRAEYSCLNCIPLKTRSKYRH